jgi:hypothetical protein
VKVDRSVACVGDDDPGMMYASCGEAHPVTKEMAREREPRSARLVKVVEMPPSASEDRCSPLTTPAVRRAAIEVLSIFGQIEETNQNHFVYSLKVTRCYYLNLGNSVSVAYQKQEQWLVRLPSASPCQTAHRAGGVGPAASSLRYRITGR